eukprot:GHVN01054680.1.p1 GENE.GHVN01054680.1~~GHVN01054680.1.p1  ORF type:complete len:135 (+),score=11.13 GHVN01054680.1:113-517(+)
MEAGRARAVKRAADNRISGWLTATPIVANHFELAPQEFRDAIAMRYRLPLKDLPARCDGCGATADLNHLLNCKVGGLIVRRHNEIRDTLGDLLAKACGRQVQREPVIVEQRDRWFENRWTTCRSKGERTEGTSS